MKNVPDYRCGRDCPHDLAEMLVCLVDGYMHGRQSVSRAIEWCRNNVEVLKKHMKLEHGIASKSTYSRMLGGIDEEMFALCFMEWIAEIVRERGMHIAIDGKALRGAAERIKGKAAPYVLNAIDAATGLVLGQLAIDEKTNEITSIPKLLEFLEIEDNVFTIDAIGTQKNIERMIVDGGGHFVLQVKKNNPSLYDEIMDSFDALEKENRLKKDEQSRRLRPYLEKYDCWEKTEKNRERIEYREFEACRDASFLDCVSQGELPFIKSVALATQVRIPIEKDPDGNDITVGKDEFLKNGSNRKPNKTEGDGVKDDIQRIGLISDLDIGAREMAEYKRNHWKIENSLHHVLDDVLREDRSNARKSKNNLALIRKYAYNLLKIALDREHPGRGIQWMIDYVSDHPGTAEKYIFEKLESFY